MAKSSFYVRRITISAVFLSISLVLKMTFSFYLPIFGENGIRVGISDIFSIMPSILFGPVYGAIVCGLSDLFGYLLKPVGTYIPLLTLVAAAGGFIRGGLWAVLRNQSDTKMRIGIAVSSALLLLSGICNAAFLHTDGVDRNFYHQVQARDIHIDNLHLISKMLITGTIGAKDPAGTLATYLTFVTSGMIGSAILGILLLTADFFLSKKLLPDTRKGQISHLLVVMISSGVLVSTLNTVVLRETIFTAWKVLPFSVVWLPRIAEEILSNTMYAYFIAMLLGICNKVFPME